MERKARVMKHIAGTRHTARTTLAAVFAALVGAALLAGRDDICRFRRMRRM